LGVRGRSNGAYEVTSGWEGSANRAFVLSARRSWDPPSVWYTGHHYDTTVSETRIANDIAIARQQVPITLYLDTWRTFPASDDWSRQDMKPTGSYRTYDVGSVRRPVLEGADDNLVELTKSVDAYGEGGFYDAPRYVAVGDVARRVKPLLAMERFSI
jgi:hypothetical protein